MISTGIRGEEGTGPDRTLIMPEEAPESSNGHGGQQSEEAG